MLDFDGKLVATDFWPVFRAVWSNNKHKFGQKT